MPEIRATDSTQVLSAVMPITRHVPAVDHPEGQPVESEAKVELNAISSSSGEYRYGQPHFTTSSGVALTEGEKLALLEKIGLTAPVNVDVPSVYQEGETLHCTMGNWEERLQPDTYLYQWQKDGENVDNGTPHYPLTEEDNGHIFACQVTAHNVIGSTSIMSNEIEIPGGTGLERVAKEEEPGHVWDSSTEDETPPEEDNGGKHRRRRR
jgi:hypothetical protein